MPITANHKSKKEVAGKITDRDFLEITNHRCYSAKGFKTVRPEPKLTEIKDRGTKDFTTKTWIDQEIDYVNRHEANASITEKASRKNKNLIDGAARLKKPLN